MQPKLIKTELAEYAPAQYNGENKSGIRPIGEKVLVLTDQALSMTKGGISIPHEVQERQALAAETGIIIALGDDAFAWNDDKTRPWSGYKPKPGDAVFMPRYSGTVFTGDDGQRYRLVGYECIGAVREFPVGSMTIPEGMLK